MLSHPTLAECWAKTDHLGQPNLRVDTHSLIVGQVSKTLLENLLPHIRALFPAGSPTLVAAHDIGKLTPGFQLKCPLWKFHESTAADTYHDQLERNHAFVSQSYLQQAFENLEATLWLVATGGHHGSYPFGFRPRIRPSNEGGNPHFLPLRDELLNQLITTFGPLPTEPANKLDRHRVHLLTGLTILADWIGSNSVWFPVGWNQDFDANEIARKTEEIIQGLRLLPRLKKNLTFGQLFNPSAPGQFQARALQSALIKEADTSGLYIVEAPMGLGKTEAALAAAYQLWKQGHNRGLYFALPTQLTSEKIHDRIHSFLSVATDVETVQALIHCNAWLDALNVRQLSPLLDDTPNNPELDHNDTDESLRWFSTSRRQLLAPFGTGTIDQALLAVLPARFAALRFFSLAGKVVVIDEVHSYDTYTSALIDRLVEYLLKVGSTVIILSATLTARRRAELVAAAGATETSPTQAYPLLTKVPFGQKKAQHICHNLGELTQPSTVHLESTSSNSRTLYQDVAEKVLAGANVVVIRNTVALAHETFHEIKHHLTDAIPTSHRGLIHSRFPQWQRQENEEAWMTFLGKDSRHRPSGSLLVATQIVEQSVDIDADYLITDLAPVDLLIQRIGRLHRHPRPRPSGFEKPTCLVLHPEVDWNATPKAIQSQLTPHRFIYPPLALWQASNFLSEKKTLVLPEEIRSFLEDAHARLPTPDSPAAQFLEENTREQATQHFTAKQRDIFATAIDDIEGKETRYGIKPTGYLILLKSPPEEHENQIALHFVHGPAITLRPGDFSFPLARALHLNAIRLPRYLIQGSLSENPDWLTRHLPDALLAIVSDDNSNLELAHATTNTHTFEYHYDSGLTYQKSSHEAARYDSFEEDFYL